MMQLRVVKNIGSFKLEQRLKMDNYYARQLIAAGIAVEDSNDYLGAQASLTAKAELSDEETDQKPKRRYRRRDLTADSE